MRCPTCKKPVPVPAAGEPMAAFPFCSDRCRLIDLGRWLDGKYQIPVVEDDEDAAAVDRGEAPGEAGGLDPDSDGGPRRGPRRPHRGE